MFLFNFYIKYVLTNAQFTCDILENLAFYPWN